MACSWWVSICNRLLNSAPVFSSPKPALLTPWHGPSSDLRRSLTARIHSTKLGARSLALERKSQTSLRLSIGRAFPFAPLSSGFSQGLLRLFYLLPPRQVRRAYTSNERRQQEALRGCGHCLLACANTTAHAVSRSHLLSLRRSIRSV